MNGKKTHNQEYSTTYMHAGNQMQLCMITMILYWNWQKKLNSDGCGSE